MKKLASGGSYLKDQRSISEILRFAQNDSFKQFFSIALVLVAGTCRAEVADNRLLVQVDLQLSNLRIQTIVTIFLAAFGLVVVLPVTSKDKGIPFHATVEPPEGGVKIQSFIKCEDVRSIYDCISDKNFSIFSNC